MAELFIAVSSKIKSKFEPELDERTAGRWRECVQFVALLPGEKTYNNGRLEKYAQDSPQLTIFAQHDITSSWLDGMPRVYRLTRSEMIARINDWLAQRGITWRGMAKVAKENGPYRWAGVDEWCRQFHRVDSKYGLRVAAGILAQLNIVPPQAFAEHLAVEPGSSHVAYFLGSDPHSGDFGLINSLAARIPGSQLHEIFKLPPLAQDANLHVMMDAAWSGGEALRRLQCMSQSCDKKHGVGAGNRLILHFAYMTTKAQSKLMAASNAMVADGRRSKEIAIVCPTGNLLATDFGGLAFQNKHICHYVDPVNQDTMRRICEVIGAQIAKKRPLGTAGLASTIGFVHSLPRAMLPVLITSGEVKANDGSTFTWQPLLESRHVTQPARDIANYYCSTCPLAPEFAK